MAISNFKAQHSTKVIPNAIIDGLIAYESADYGGGFLNYTPPVVDQDNDIRVVQDTNATTPGIRLYVKVNGSWFFVDLTAA